MRPNHPLERQLSSKSIGGSGSSSAGHDQEACWSNPAQRTGQVECKRAGKSVQLPSQKLDCRVESCHAPPCLILGATWIADGQSPINVVDDHLKNKKM